jgi:NAD(P)-dependent dehydrogenase (short-subunit alcohol dehydrogenase family)
MASNNYLRSAWKDVQFSFSIGATVALLSVVYSVSCIVFRKGILEQVHRYELSQALATVAIGFGIISHEAIQAKRLTFIQEALATAVSVATIRWTHRTQITGPRHYSLGPCEDLHGKIVIVTGSTSGLGFVSAKALAESGATVIIACRDIEMGEKVRKTIADETKNERIFVEALDLTSFRSVREFAHRMEQKFPVIDILINNAGAMLTKRCVTEDGYEMMLQTNCLSPFLLTNLLVPNMRRSTLPFGARVVNVTSSSSRYQRKIVLDDLNAEKYFLTLFTYGHSKFCLNQLSFELAQRLKNERITVNLSHPGAVITNVTRDFALWLRMGQKLIRYLNKTPEEGMQTILFLAASQNLRGVSGEAFEHSHRCQDVRVDEQSLLKFWEFAEKATGLNIK